MSTESTDLPKHIAIVMDGNGRWAKRRFLPRTSGHREGVKAVRKVIELCVEQRIEVLTLFAFSSENWRRPPDEVNILMELFMVVLKKEVSKLHKNNVCLHIIGDRGAFSETLQQLIISAETLTANNTGLVLNVAANYGGRWDIVQAVRQLAKQLEEKAIMVDDINEQSLAQYITLADYPEPDLFIRTGGDTRISNFLLWQLAYTELYFTQTLWPDFDQQTFADALAAYTSRQRRFGQTGEQLEQPDA